MSDVSTKPPSKPSTSAEATPTVPLRKCSFAMSLSSFCLIHVCHFAPPPLAPHVSTDDESSSLGVIVGVIVGGTVLIGAIILIYFFFCRGGADRMNTSSRKLTIKQKSKSKSRNSKRKSVSTKKNKSKKK